MIATLPMVESLVRAIVTDPEAVRVEEIPGDRSTIYEIHAAKNDIGRIVGREGRVIKALRILVRAAASADVADPSESPRIDLELLD